jgi:hypothetical protein
MFGVIDAKADSVMASVNEAVNVRVGGKSGVRVDVSVSDRVVVADAAIGILFIGF